MSFVRLKPQILIQIRVGDLFQRLDLVDRNQMRVLVHELNRDFLECALSEQMSLDAGQRFMRVIIGLSITFTMILNIIHED